ncbi:MAG: hypothetical protein JNL39_08265 [Opitutaceae bacterium]|nr:hypothetical protein [Opitutaceae bacterium]
MNWDEHKEEKERRRFVEAGVDKRPPVVGSAIIFFAVWLGGWGCSSLLHVLGMKSIPLRYAISTLVSYGIFIWSVGVWCRHVAKPRKPSSGWGSPIDGINGLEGDGEGCLLVLAVLAIGLLFSGVFYFMGGYALLFEVAFEIAFAGTMVYRMGKRATLGDWAGALLQRTWLPALVTAGILVALGATMQARHPEASTMAQAIKAYRAEKK